MEEAWKTAEQIWSQVATSFRDQGLPLLDQLGVLLSNPWARALGLCIIVYLTIRVIASVYSGDKQNSELGPVGIRPHTAQRLDHRTIVLPRKLMPMNMDGVSADLKVFYAYTDARGKPCKQLVHTIRHCRIAVSPTNLPRVTNTIYGHEIPDVATADVCFPPVEIEAPPAEMPATPERARDYAALHKIVENWHEDDDALLISLHSDQREEVSDNREQFITHVARKVAAARQRRWPMRLFNGGVAKRRPNVVGSYYLKFEFSHDPWFVLTRHPDRELKMTAWLTVLTSMFALVMDAWPTENTQARPRPHDAPAGHSVPAAPRVISSGPH